MPAIKCLHVITGLSMGGAEKALYNVLSGGLATRYKSHVMSLSDEGSFGRKIRELDVPVSCAGIRGSIPSIASVLKLRRLSREFCPDVIQGWMYHGNLAASLATIMATGNPRLVWNIRQSLYDIKEEKPITRQVIRANCFFSGKPKKILYNSRLSRDQHEAIGFSEANGKVIPNGFDLTVLRPSNTDAIVVKEALNIPESTLVVAHVARFHPMKDHTGFLRSAVQVGARIQDVHFVLCGKDVVPSNKLLLDIVPDSMRERFHWLGERNDVPKLMRAADVFCQSAWSEAFPNVLGEAMASGVPCVATDVGDSANIVGETGLVVPPRDEAALVEALIRILGMPADERQAMGQAALARVVERYSLSNMVDEYAAVYEKLARYSTSKN